jgi:amidase
MSALAAREAMRTGTLTSEPLTKACFERIDAREAEIGAWAHLDTRAVLDAARASNCQGHVGALAGLPIAIKDLFDTCDMPTGYGSPIYAGYQPRIDAAVVALIRRAGGVLMGKTVTTEFAMFSPGKTRNPHAPEHTPGGSSSGSAAAVAAGMVPLALGTQTAGSIVRPASFCGVVGYKPTFDLISPAGVKPAAWTLGTVGVFARDIDDAAFFAGALSGHDLLDASRAVSQPPRFGLCKTPQWAFADADSRAALAESAHRIAAEAGSVVNVALPPAFDALLDAQHTIMAYELARTLAFEYDTAASQISDRLRAILDEGQMIDGAAYDAARRVADECRSGLDAVFANAGVDVLIAPSAPGEAPLRRQGTGDPVFNRIWTLLGVPCINVPGLTGATGLPVGVQVVGKCNDDATALAAARWLATSIQAPTRD